MPQSDGVVSVPDMATLRNVVRHQFITACVVLTLNDELVALYRYSEICLDYCTSTSYGSNCQSLPFKWSSKFHSRLACNNRVIFCHPSSVRLKKYLKNIAHIMLSLLLLDFYILFRGVLYGNVHINERCSIVYIVIRE